MIPSQNYSQYTNPVFPPKIYIDEKNDVRLFIEIENPLQLNFEHILQCITPDADLSSTPTLKSYVSEDTKFSILNYTKVNLYFNEKKKLYAESNKIIGFTPDDCRIVTYNTLEHPEVICVEQKDDQDNFPGLRFFITNHEGKYIYNQAAWLHGSKYLPFFKQIPFQIANVETFIAENNCMKGLIQKMDKNAIINKNPTLIQFRKLKNKPQFTVLNYTNEKITFDLFRRQFINNHNITQFTKDDRQMIIYHTTDHGTVICMEQQDEFKTEDSPRMHHKLVWKESDEVICKPIFIDARKRETVNIFWNAMRDNNCLFSVNGVPNDVVTYIAMTYFNVLNAPAKEPETKDLKITHIDDNEVEIDDLEIQDRDYFIRIFHQYQLMQGGEIDWEDGLEFRAD